MTATFPSFPGVTLPMRRKVLWRTLIQESVAGVETAQSPWTYPRYQWELPFSVFRTVASTLFSVGEIQTIIKFYNTQAGRGLPFLYTDTNDSTSGTDQTIGTADGTTTISFQLVRSYGGYVEPVFGVSTSSSDFVIKVGSTTVSSTNYAVTNKGVLTFASSTTALAASAQTIAWNGSFKWYVRFDADEYQFEQFTVSTGVGGPLWSIPKISFTSIKFGA